MLLKLGHIWYHNDQRDEADILGYETWRLHAKRVFVYISKNVETPTEKKLFRFSISEAVEARPAHDVFYLE